MPEIIEKFIRYVDDMAGQEFDDAERLMRKAYKAAGIDIHQDDALDLLIEHLTS